MVLLSKRRSPAVSCLAREPDEEAMTHEELPYQRESISGAWILDLSRSDSLQGYLRFMGHSEADIRALMAGERAYQSRNVIALDESRLIIRKDTVVNHCTQMFYLDREHISPARSGGGVVRATASLGDGSGLDGYVVAGTTTTPGGVEVMATVEERQLLESGVDHIQQIDVEKMATGEHFVISRTWVRVVPTQDDHDRLFG